LSDPIWPQIIGPPSSAKTEIINAHSKIPAAFNLSSLTSKTLVSGEKNNKNASLLTRIGEFGIILVKDFTTVLELPHNERSEIFAQMREVYDGSYSKSFGTGQTVSWSGKIGFLGACTPIIERYTKKISALGERFLFCRINDLTPENIDKALDKSLDSHSDTVNSYRISLQEKVKEFIVSNLQTSLDFEISLTEEEKEFLKKCSKFIAQVRSEVIRDSYDRDTILVKPFAEAPMRVSKQLKSLLKGYCIIDKVKSPEKRHLELIYRVTLDNLPPMKREILDRIPDNGIQRAELGRKLGYKTDGGFFTRLIEDLNRTGIVKTDKPYKEVFVSKTDIVMDFYSLVDRDDENNIDATSSAFLNTNELQTSSREEVCDIEDLDQLFESHGTN